MPGKVGLPECLVLSDPLDAYILRIAVGQMKKFGDRR